MQIFKNLEEHIEHIALVLLVTALSIIAHFIKNLKHFKPTSSQDGVGFLFLCISRVFVIHFQIKVFTFKHNGGKFNTL